MIAYEKLIQNQCHTLQIKKHDNSSQKQLLGQNYVPIICSLVLPKTTAETQSLRRERSWGGWSSSSILCRMFSDLKTAKHNFRREKSPSRILISPMHNKYLWEKNLRWSSLFSLSDQTLLTTCKVLKYRVAAVLAMGPWVGCLRSRAWESGVLLRRFRGCVSRWASGGSRRNQRGSEAPLWVWVAQGVRGVCRHKGGPGQPEQRVSSGARELCGCGTNASTARSKCRSAARGNRVAAVSSTVFHGRLPTKQAVIQIFPSCGKLSLDILTIWHQFGILFSIKWRHMNRKWIDPESTSSHQKII